MSELSRSLITVGTVFTGSEWYSYLAAADGTLLMLAGPPGADDDRAPLPIARHGTREAAERNARRALARHRRLASLDCPVYRHHRTPEQLQRMLDGVERSAWVDFDHVTEGPVSREDAVGSLASLLRD